MFFRLRARYLVDKRLAFSAAEAPQKGLFLHRMLDVELRRANLDKVAPNGHGNCAAPDNEIRHDRFPHPSHPPEGEGDKVSLREFHYVRRGQSVYSIAIVPPLDDRSSYATGESFEFDINVFTGTQDGLAVMTMALFNLERMGRETAQPRLQLTRLSAITTGRLPVALYDADSCPDFLEPDIPAVDADALCAPIAVSSEALLLETVTPIIITSPAKRHLKLEAQAPKLGRLVRAILRRCDDCWPDALAALTRQTSRDALEAHADNLDRSAGAILNEPFPAASFWYGSSTHPEPLRFSGYTGRIVMNRDWQPLLPVLRVGSWLQVGQKTALGFGVYRLGSAAPE